MKKPSLLRLLWLLFFIGCASPSVSAGPQSWSQTTPQINLKHIFEGEINRFGKPTGLHHIKNNLKTARIHEILSPENKFGIYTAIVEIYDAESKSWKQKFSSMFPDRYSQEEVLSVILHALENASQKQPGKWRSSSGRGYEIEGYRLKNMKIITAYPIYVKTN
ncbi:EndoU domain-containing protein [Sneathiella glossodoripedis]|uniref:EndoU domain-containing protein n=1 Tax=Sneathiella glossodoripedis TaxID=418853 RepID=UPI00046ED49E|nr:EndoU domain-containing protein [Sneathiella glossodoripedis]